MTTTATTKVKFATEGGVTEADGEVVSRTGGTIAVVSVLHECDFDDADGNPHTIIKYSATHVLTGAAIRSKFSESKHVEQFARAFYRQCSDEEKKSMRTISDPFQLTRLFELSTKRFVGNWTHHK